MSVFTRRTLLSATLALGAVVTAALPAAAQQKSIKVGVMSGAEEEVAQVVKKVRPPRA
jgi:D-methionine transport system substrate-binding protein